MTNERRALLNALSTLRVTELAEFVRDLEREWGVCAATAVVAPDPTPPNPAPDPERPLDVVLTGIAGRRIEVLKALRKVRGELPLAELRAILDDLPHTVGDQLAPDEARALSERLRAAGGCVELR